MEIIRLLHSRALTVVAAILMVVATLVAVNSGAVAPIEGSRGLVYPSANLWIGTPGWSAALNMALIIVIGVIGIAILKTFNIMRAQTALWATMFVIMMGCIPDFAGQFNGGTLLCLAMAFVTAVMYSCYGRHDAPRRVYLMFLILGLGSLVQYAFLVYIPVLFIGLAQMRILTLRSVLAAIFGVITPGWVLFGCGIIGWDDVTWPSFAGIAERLTDLRMIASIVIVVLTAILGIFMMSGNVIKVLGYNNKFRAANGFMTVAMLITILAIIADFRNMGAYVPTLNFLVAYQVAHFFSNRRYKQSYIAVAVIIAIYIAAYIVNLTL